VKRWPISRKTRIFVVEPAHQAFEPTVQKRSAELRDAEDDRGALFEDLSRWTWRLP
jgi:hypothetical protein